MKLEFLESLLGAECVMCGDSGEGWLCGGCSHGLRPVTRRFPNGPDVIAAGGVDPQLIQAVSLWKDRGVRGLTKPFAQLMWLACQSRCEEVSACAPLPQRRASRRQRGWAPVPSLAREFSAVSGIPLVESLHWLREPADQRGLSVSGRAANLALAMGCSSGYGGLLLIDDVVTSGASLQEAARAVQAAGGSLAGAVTVVAAR